MTTLNASDFAPYLVAFKAKYGHEYRGTTDDIETMILEGGDDNIDYVIEGMSVDEEERGLVTEDESEAFAKGDRSIAVVDDTIGSPYSYAVKIDAQFEQDLERQWQAALQNKRGAAVIMNDLFRVFGKETVCQVWPKPGSYKKGHGPVEKQVGDNDPFDKQKTVVRKPDGTTSEGERSFYADLVALSVRGKEITDAIEAAKEETTDIEKITNKATLQMKLSNYKSAIVRGVELGQRLYFCNQHTRMAAEIITDKDGEPKRSPKLVWVWDMDDRKNFTILSIGQFLGKKVWQDAMYSEIIAKKVRQSGEPSGDDFNLLVQGKLPLPRFDTVMAAVATFAEDVTNGRLRGDMKEYNALLTKLNGAGSDPLLMSMHSFSSFLDGLLSQPAFQKRIANNLQGRKTG